MSKAAEYQAEDAKHFKDVGIRNLKKKKNNLFFFFKIVVDVSKYTAAKYLHSFNEIGRNRLKNS